MSARGHRQYAEYRDDKQKRLRRTNHGGLPYKQPVSSQVRGPAKKDKLRESRYLALRGTRPSESTQGFPVFAF